MIKKFPVSHLTSAIPTLNEFLKRFQLDKVITRGGLIAGGFPRHMMRHGLDQRQAVDYFSGRRGDIDIFYPSREVMRSVLRERVCNRHKSRANYQSSLGGFSVEELIPFYGNGTDFVLKIQHVACVNGTPEEILSQFDLVNAIVGFNNEFVYFHEERAKFEQNNIIAINREATLNSFVPNRLGKYARVHGYRGIDQYSFDKIRDFVFDIAISSMSNNTHPLTDRLPKSQPFNLYNELALSAPFPQFIGPPTLESIIGKLAPFMTRELILPFLGAHYNVSVRSSYGALSTTTSADLGRALLMNHKLSSKIITT